MIRGDQAAGALPCPLASARIGETRIRRNRLKPAETAAEWRMSSQIWRVTSHGDRVADITAMRQACDRHVTGA